MLTTGAGLTARPHGVLLSVRQGGGGGPLGGAFSALACSGGTDLQLLQHSGVTRGIPQVRTAACFSLSGGGGCLHGV